MGIAAIAAIEMIVGYRNEGVGSEHFQLFAVVFVAATFMFFLRKRQRRKIEENKEKQ